MICRVGGGPEVIGDEDVEAIIIVVVTRRLLVDPCPSFCRGKTAPGGGCGSRIPPVLEDFLYSHPLVRASAARAQATALSYAPTTPHHRN